MWTREKSGGGRGVWGCVRNLFFFFPRNPLDVDGDPVDVSVASFRVKIVAKKFFSRARESSFLRKSNHQVYFLFVLVVLFFS